MDDRTVPDILGRDVPSMRHTDPSAGGRVPPVRDGADVDAASESARARSRERAAQFARAAKTVTEAARRYEAARTDTDDAREQRPAQRTSASLADAAHALVEGERQRAYGEPTSYLQRVADAWSAVLQRPFTREEVALAYATAKLVREGNKPAFENRVDATGYLEILERCYADE